MRIKTFSIQSLVLQSEIIIFVRFHAESSFVFRLSIECTCHFEHKEELKGFTDLHSWFEIVFALVDSDGSHILGSVRLKVSSELFKAFH